MFRFAARNLLRSKFRTFLTLLGVAVAIVAFVMLRTVISAWGDAIKYSAKDRIATRHKVTFVMQLPKHYIDTVRAVPGVQAATFMNWFGARYPKAPNEFFGNIAVDTGSFLEVMDEFVVEPAAKQRWLEDRQGALVGDVIARKFGWKVGDKVTLEGTIYPGNWTFNISGLYTTSRRSWDRSTLFFHWDYMNDALPERRKDDIGWITSRIADAGQSAQVGQAIDGIFDEKDVQTLTMSEAAMNQSFMGMFSAMLTAIDVVSIVILGIMMLILGNTIAMGVRERTNEYGVLRAIGFLPRHVAGFIVTEALTVGLAGGVLGLAIAYPFVEKGLGRWLEENMGAWFPYFRIAPSTIVAAITLAVVLAFVAAVIPAYRASKLSVVDALRRVG